MAGTAKKSPGDIPAFTRKEFEQRVERARKLMTRHKLDGMMVCSEVNVEYLAGFRTQFSWNTPTRPWYFILPRVGEAVGVIPEHGAAAWPASSWCKNLMTWRSPHPENEGLDLLTGVIGSIRRRYGRFGVELGPESRLGMPVADLLRLREMIRPVEMADCIGVMRELRLIKSAAEVRRIRFICRVASEAFDALPPLIGPGDSERDVMRAFQLEALKRGVDKTPFVMPRAGRNGYEGIIAGPTNRKLRKGDILFIDQGCKHDGYFCDFNRNFAIGEPTDTIKRANALLYRSVSAGIRAARPGTTAEGLHRAQAGVLEEAGLTRGDIGRFGHGLGKNLTEPPSNMPGDRTRLAPGMVVTIEPSLMLGGDKILVREEIVVVTETGCRLLTRREPPAMPVVAA